LRDLPYKIELNDLGHIEMTPASNHHGYLQSELVWLLRSQLQQGRVITECSIDTPKGVKVADVAWCSPEFVAAHGGATPFPQAPEICIEVVSPSNSFAEMQDKVLLYLAKGAREVWLVKETGDVLLHRTEGVVGGSLFVAKTQVTL